MQAIASLLRWARERPDDVAITRDGRVTTWRELLEQVRGVACGLQRRGIVPGDRVAMLVPPSKNLLAVTYACLVIGAVPVFLDPGLGLVRLLRLLRSSGAVAFVGTPVAHVLRHLMGVPGLRLIVSTRPWPGCTSLRRLAHASQELPPVVVDMNAPGLVLYTSGATGEPKGVTVSRATLDAQAQALCQLAGLDSTAVLLAVLPAMLLIGPASGCITRIPVRRRDLADDLVASTHSFGSPAVWGPLASELERVGRTLPGMRCLLFGGCAIDPTLIRRWRALAPQAALASVYGATEGVPLSWAFAEELLASDGEGTLIGRPSPGIDWELVPVGTTAELCSIRVRGSVVAGGSWIDLGDLVRCDDAGRWWFLGRTSERVECDGQTWATVLVEERFRHPLVRRVALVGVGERPQQMPVLVIEPQRWPWTRRAATAIIAATLATDGELTQALGLTPERVLLRRRLPVDARHRAKILRHELAAWAAERLPAAVIARRA